MAIRLNSASLSKPFSFISIHDGAVDKDKKGFEDEWQRYKDGAPGAEPPLVDGVEPTVWELTPITNAKLLGHLAGKLVDGNNIAWAIAYAAYGITGVDNLEDEDGNPIELKRERIDGYMAVRESQFVKIPAPILIEIGQALISHNSPNAD